MGKNVYSSEINWAVAKDKMSGQERLPNQDLDEEISKQWNSPVRPAYRQAIFDWAWPGVRNELKNKDRQNYLYTNKVPSK